MKRPQGYFDPENPDWPEEAELSLTMPPSLKGLFEDDALRSAVRRELRDQEAKARVEVRRRGWRVVGSERLRRMSPYRRAKSFEPLRKRNPTFAVGRGQRRAFFEAAAELRAFRRAYRTALSRWRKGHRHTEFPEGTWAMRWVHGVCVVDTG